MAYTEPFADSASHVVDVAVDAANVVSQTAADRAIEHNRINGYTQHQLTQAQAQVTRLRAHITALGVRQTAIAAFIATLEALTP